MEKKLCILNSDIDEELKNKIDSGTLSFENDVTERNGFIELAFENNMSQSQEFKYAHKPKSDYTIVQLSFYMYHNNERRPYIIDRIKYKYSDVVGKREYHRISSGKSILFSMTPYRDKEGNNPFNSIGNKIDEFVYKDTGNIYLNILNIFKKNKLKYNIRYSGYGYNKLDNQADYIFFIYAVDIDNANNTSTEDRIFLNYEKKKEDSFSISEKNYESFFKNCVENLIEAENEDSISEYCIKNKLDIVLLQSVYNTETTRKIFEFKTAKFFISNINLSQPVYSKFNTNSKRIYAILKKTLKTHGFSIAFSIALSQGLAGYGLFVGALIPHLVNELYNKVQNINVLFQL